ncbi:MAG: hypothetical protein AAF368_20940 [Planctomycetota bacterium]
MTKTLQHSYELQRGEKTPVRATCRYRTQRPDPAGPDIMCLPNNEWGYLLSALKELRGCLREEFAGGAVQSESDNAWIRDRLIEAGILIDLVDGPELRRGFLDWIGSVGEELELIHERRSPKLL